MNDFSSISSHFNMILIGYFTRWDDLIYSDIYSGRVICQHRCFRIELLSEENNLFIIFCG